MSEPEQGDLWAQRRDTGIARAVQHADRVVDQWSEDAYRLLTAWAPGREFLTEDFVDFARANLPAPPDRRAFGGPVLRAARAGLIHRVGYRLDRYKSPKPLWRGNQ